MKVENERGVEIMIKENKRNNTSCISSNNNTTCNTCNSKYKYSI